MRNILCAAVVGALTWPAVGQTPGAPRNNERRKAEPVVRSTPLVRQVRSLSAQQLSRVRVGEIAFEGVPLEQVLDWLAEYTGSNVVVRWSDLQAVGIERDKPISVRARNLPLSQALWMIMNEAAGQTGARLAYRAGGNVILFSTFEDLNRDMVVKVYDVRDLLAAVPFHANARFGNDIQYVESVQPRVAAGAVAFQPVIGRAFSGVELYTDDDEGERFEDEWNDGREKAMRELIDAVVASIEPDSWQVNGGPGTIVPFKDSFLVVRNSPLVHQQIGGPLTDREAP